MESTIVRLSLDLAGFLNHSVLEYHWVLTEREREKVVYYLHRRPILFALVAYVKKALRFIQCR
jgi:hypothetical protein